ncbi:MAG: DUF4293 domain-containing protein [Rikenellaceae bacterium]|nr:DUF4293 domain-containing protein [Rikenellaceae bacterium]
MIQRKQSLYMLIAAICMAIVSVNELFTFNASTISMEVHTYGAYLVENDTATWLGFTVKALCFAAICAISTVLMLVNIFLYKKRETQLSILYAQYPLILGGVGYGVYYVWSMSNTFDEVITQYNLDVLTAVPSWSLALPVVALVMNFLATRGVAADIALLRSVDRIR